MQKFENLGGKKKKASLCRSLFFAAPTRSFFRLVAAVMVVSVA